MHIGLIAVQAYTINEQRFAKIREQCYLSEGLWYKIYLGWVGPIVPCILLAKYVTHFSLLPTLW